MTKKPPSPPVRTGPIVMVSLFIARLHQSILLSPHIPHGKQTLYGPPRDHMRAGATWQDEVDRIVSEQLNITPEQQRAHFDRPRFGAVFNCPQAPGGHTVEVVYTASWTISFSAHTQEPKPPEPWAWHDSRSLPKDVLPMVLNHSLMNSMGLYYKDLSS